MATIQLFETLKLWLKRSLTVYVAALAVESLACLGVIALLYGGDMSAGPTQRVGLCLLIMAACSFVELGMNIALAVLFLRMLYKAVQRAQGFATPFTYVSPGWAVGYWFIPLMNLYRPFEVVKALFKACTAEAGGKPAAGEQLLSAWWALFLLSNIVGWMVGRMDTDLTTAAGILTYAEYTLGSNLLFIAAAWLFWLVIQRLVVAMGDTDKSEAVTQHA